MKQPKDLLIASKEEKQKFLGSFDTVLFDCDGVIWDIHNQVIARAPEGLACVSGCKDIFFLSNNSSRTTEFLEKSFRDFGVKVDLKEQFYSTAQSIAQYLKSLNFDKSIYLIGNPTLDTFLRTHGFQVVRGPNVVQEGQYREQLKSVAPNVGAVVFDTDLNLNLIKIHQAEIHLLDPTCLLIFGATDDQYDLGKFKLSASSKFRHLLEDPFKRRPIVLGKPGSELCAIIRKKFEGRRVLFVGDSLDTDIPFANAMGFQSLLVFSGTTTKADMKEAVLDTDKIPDYFVDSLGVFGDIFKEV